MASKQITTLVSAIALSVALSGCISLDDNIAVADMTKTMQPMDPPMKNPDNPPCTTDCGGPPPSNMETPREGLITAGTVGFAPGGFEVAGLSDLVVGQVDMENGSATLLDPEIKILEAGERDGEPSYLVYAKDLNVLSGVSEDSLGALPEKLPSALMELAESLPSVLMNAVTGIPENQELRVGEITADLNPVVSVDGLVVTVSPGLLTNLAAKGPGAVMALAEGLAEGSLGLQSDELTVGDMPVDAGGGLPGGGETDPQAALMDAVAMITEGAMFPTDPQAALMDAVAMITEGAMFPTDPQAALEGAVAMITEGANIPTTPEGVQPFVQGLLSGLMQQR